MSDVITNFGRKEGTIQADAVTKAHLVGAFLKMALIAGGAETWLTVTLVLGLLAFGFVFALNSALHSYLILALSAHERVTMDVGFYYMANAAGRLLGTLLSGLSYQIGGLPLCLATSAAMAGASWLAMRRLTP